MSRATNPQKLAMEFFKLKAQINGKRDRITINDQDRAWDLLDKAKAFLEKNK